MTPQEYDVQREHVRGLRVRATRAEIEESALAVVYRRAYESENSKFRARVRHEGVHVAEPDEPTVIGNNLLRPIRERLQAGEPVDEEEYTLVSPPVRLRGQRPATERQANSLWGSTRISDRFRGMAAELDRSAIPTPPNPPANNAAEERSDFSGTQHHRLRFASSLES